MVSRQNVMGFASHRQLGGLCHFIHNSSELWLAVVMASFQLRRGVSDA